MPSVYRCLKSMLATYQLRRQLAALTIEIEKLRAENSRMRTGMRRCVSCEYRLAYKRRPRNEGGSLQDQHQAT